MVLAKVINKKHLRIIVYLLAVSIFGYQAFTFLYPKVSLYFLDKAYASEIGLEKKVLAKVLGYFNSQNKDPKVITIKEIQTVQWLDESLGTSPVVNQYNLKPVLGFKAEVQVDGQVFSVHADSALQKVYLLKDGKLLE